MVIMPNRVASKGFLHWSNVNRSLFKTACKKTAVKHQSGVLPIDVSQKMSSLFSGLSEEQIAAVLTTIQIEFELVKSLGKGEVPRCEGATFINITPEIAEMFLSKNIENNRGIDRRRVDAMVQTMLKGDWKTNGQGLIFDTNGNLIDGQHRLSSIIKSGTTCRVLVVFGIPTNVFSTLDQHKTRSTRDMLTTKGIKTVTGLGGGAELLYHYKNGNVKDIFNNRKRASKTDILGVIDEFPGLLDSAYLVSKVKGLTRFVSPDVRVFFHYVFSEIDEEKAVEFFSLMSTGYGLSIGHPIATYRQRVINYMSAGKSGYAFTTKEQLIYLVRVWNAFLKGTTIKKLEIKKDRSSEIPAISKP